MEKSYFDLSLLNISNPCFKLLFNKKKKQVNHIQIDGQRQF